jgi:hypothetical protein
MMTDNSTAESCFYRGTSSSYKLFERVLRLRRLEMTAGLIIHVVHCAGTRMISQGTNGLSRGNLLEGVMKGDDFLSFVPLHLLALERSPDLEGWFKGMFRHNELEVLAPGDWFQLGHDIRSWREAGKGLWYPSLRAGTYLWHPPPAAARFALEELRRSRLKRQDSTHVFVCPGCWPLTGEGNCIKWPTLFLKFRVTRCPNGMVLTMNLLLLALFFLSCVTGPGSCGIHPSFERWQGNCACCGKRVPPMQVLFCANFASL